MQMKWRAAVVGILLVIVAAGPGRAQTTSLTVDSEALGTERTVYVRLPADYDQSTDSYPVLYFTDGEAIDRVVVPTVNSLVDAGAVPEMILIGIPHPDRGHDLTPTPIDSRPGSGGGEAFLRFIAEELIPYVDANYRTGPTRLLYGHSLGGLFSAYAMARDPGLFVGFIASSPVISWDDWYVRDLAADAFEDSENLDVYLALSVGSEEPPRFLDRGAEFAEWLEENAPDGVRWTFKIYEGEEHMSVWPLSLRDGLTGFFAQSD